MIYELRTYRVHPGRMDALLARFRDHTCGLFERHGMTNVGYWTNGTDDELIYFLSFEDLEAHERAWASFRADSEWAKVRASSEEDGPIVAHIETRLLTPTDFSALT